MIATRDQFKILMDIAETDDSQNDLLDLYLNAVDALFNKLCGYEFDSTDYTNDEYNGDGGQYLWLRNIPVTAISQISTSRLAAIEVKNTTTDASSATINIDVSAQTLAHAIVGGASAASGSIDLTDSGSDTLAELVTTIDALGSGWDAQMLDTNLNSVPSTELLEVLGLNVGKPRSGGDASYKPLDIPGTPADDVKIDDATNGRLYRSSGFSSGINNITVSYTAGYTSSTMPDDVTLAGLAGAQALYQRGEEDGFGANDFSDGSLSVKYGEWLPDLTLRTIAQHRRIVVA